MREWWRSIEEQLDAHSERAPDPWCDRAGGPVELTDEQQQFLGSLDDQPPIIRATDGPELMSLHADPDHDRSFAVPRQDPARTTG
jgi:hypothetical protein